jgi:NOL1/NOP2/fmu family ribosome biogenesis protein
MSKNFQAYLKLKKKGLEDKYVVIVKGNIVGKGKDIERLLSTVKKRYPKAMPLIAKIPSEEVLILW